MLGKNWYFGKDEANQFGDLISEKLSGHTVSKRIDKSQYPGGLEYEATKLGMDLFDLLAALEGMCYEGKAQEIDDSTYLVF